jgi:hypothetical protein
VPLEFDKLHSSFNFKSPELGASASVFLTGQSEYAELNGEYISAGKVGKPSVYAQNEALAETLWERSVNIVSAL